MTKIDDLIEKNAEENKKFAKIYDEEAQRLDIAVMVMQLRNELGLSQRELAKLVGKPQSTIARIESGATTPTFKVLYEIAARAGKTLHVEFK